MSTRIPFHGAFTITGPFGQTTGEWAGKTPHAGLDMVGVSDKTVYSPVNGTVAFAGSNNDGFGNYVRIVDSNGVSHFLAHMSSVAAIKGRAVIVGDKLGIMGQTGNATGPHTHYEIRKPHTKDSGYDLQNPATALGIPNAVGSYNSANYPYTPNTIKFPGRGYFGNGKVNDYILTLDKALIGHGYGWCYQYGANGASRSWGPGSYKACKQFQLDQGWRGSDADGYPGPVTWARLGL